MTELTRIAFTAAELRQLRTLACALLTEPGGVFPGPAVDARARVTAAMKVLRADADASHRKFLDFPPLAPFAVRVIVEQLAPAACSVPARVSRTPQLTPTGDGTARRRPAKAVRRRARDASAAAASDAGTARAAAQEHKR